MQKVTKIKKLLISNSFFKFWKYQFLVRSYNKKIKPYKIFREILNVGDVVFALCFSPEEKKASMIDNIYSIYNKIGLSKKELRMLWGMHKKLKNQPKS